MTPINYRAIREASSEQLGAWLDNLNTALWAPKPDDLTDFAYSETTYWIDELAAAIRTELDRRRRTGENHGTGAARTRAAI